jgi:hypothetical protein
LQGTKGYNWKPNNGYRIKYVVAIKFETKCIAKKLPLKYNGKIPRVQFQCREDKGFHLKITSRAQSDNLHEKIELGVRLRIYLFPCVWVVLVMGLEPPV